MTVGGGHAERRSSAGSTSGSGRRPARTSGSRWPDGDRRAVASPTSPPDAVRATIDRGRPRDRSVPWTPTGGSATTRTAPATSRARASPTSTCRDFGAPERRPELPAGALPGADRALRARMRGPRLRPARRLRRSRAQRATSSFLTGFDPRFEEAILVVGPDGDPAILVGNECWGMAGAAPLPMRRILFQDLSLPGQPRDRSRPLARDPRATRASARARGSASSAGRRTPTGRRSRRRRSSSTSCGASPGRAASVENAGDLLIDPADGLRVDQRRRPARGARVGRDARRRAASGRLLDGPPARADRARGGRGSSAGTGRRCRAT